MRQTFNEWLRTSPIFDGCIDFDAAVRSTINPRCVDKIKPATKATRDAHIAKYAERRGNELVVVRDAVFDSPSGAAVFCVGGSSNGWRDWKDENNNRLETYRK